LRDGDWDFDESPDLLFETESMLQAFVAAPNEYSGKGYITCDAAAMGEDRTVICIWRGLYLVKIFTFKHKYPHEVAEVLRTMASERGIPLSNVVVDADGLGIGIAGILRCKEFNNGSSAVDKEHYANLKAECYFKLSEYMALNKVFIIDHEHKEGIMKELDLIRDRTKEDKRKAVSTKDEIKQGIGYSPDFADAIMMRMYFELVKNAGVYAFV